MTISFVIPVRNDARRLAACLRTIRANRYPAHQVEIVVVDNGSTDDPASVARQYDAEVLSLPQLRLGMLRNRGVAAATGDVLAFVDADHEIGPDWIAAAVETLSRHDVAAVGAACSPPQPGTRVQELYDRLRRHPERQEAVDWLGSGNMAVKRSAFETIGGFDESLETCEDVDLCRKLRTLHYAIIADPRLQNIHHGDPATLPHVFLGEMWRGRDNVRVSLRAPRSWATLLSAAIPTCTLLALFAASAGLLSVTTIGWRISLLCGLFVAALIAARAGRMILYGAPLGDLPRALSVAAAYELGRAVALAAPLSYGLRRRGASA